MVKRDMESLPQMRPTPLSSLPPSLATPWISGDCSLPQQAAYDTGLELLERQEAGLALPRLEEALQGSLAQMESCRADCQGPEEQEGAEEEEDEAGSQGGLYEAIASTGLGVCVGGGSVPREGHEQAEWLMGLLCRTLDSGPAVPATLCRGNSHTPWSQLPCPRLPSQPAEAAT